MTHVKQIVTGDIQENCYLIYNQQGVIIVDPGNDSEKIQALIKEINLVPAAILLTHTHYDHIGAVEELRKFYSIPVYVSPLEQEWLGNPQHNLSGLDRHNNIANVIVSPAEYEFAFKKYSLAGIDFSVVPTPGHSIGSVSFIFNSFVLTGDALFKGSVGRTDLYTGNLEQLLQGIQTQLFILPDEFTAYPGHGLPTTIGQEKSSNPFFQ